MEEPVDLEEAGETLPLHADEGPIGFQPYVLDLQGMGHGSATVQKCLAIAVMVREDGLLLALPELALLGEVLGAGMQAGPLELIGPTPEWKFRRRAWTKLPSTRESGSDCNSGGFQCRRFTIFESCRQRRFDRYHGFRRFGLPFSPITCGLGAEGIGLGTVLLCGRGRGSSTAFKPQTKASEKPQQVVGHQEEDVQARLQDGSRLLQTWRRAWRRLQRCSLQ